MANEGVMVPLMVSFTRLAALALLLGCTANGLAPAKETLGCFSGPPRREKEDCWQRQTNTSALNRVLAFELYQDLATRTAGQQQQQQRQQQQQQLNILFSPLGLVSALVLLSQVSGPESQSQALGALGLAANSTEESVEASVAALVDLLHNLTLQEGGPGRGVQRAELEDGAGREAGTGATKGAGAEEPEGQTAADVEDGAEGTAGSEDRVRAGARLRVWSGLNGKSSPDYESFLSGNVSAAGGGAAVFNVSLETLVKDLQASDKPELNNYVYLKGRLPFERRPAAPQRFQLNTSDAVDVAMMFGDDSSEVMMLYDTNCSATVVQPAQSERLATLLLLPKAELRPLEECLSDARMRFWINNLRPGQAEILFPKFQLRRSYSLEGLLRSAGITTVFSESADVSRMLRERALRLVKGSQEVTLEMEETKLDRGGRPDIPLDFSVPPRITFNRPFMLIIYDKLTGLVVLMGRIVDPTDV